MREALAVAACGIILFVWGFVSWTILPWHDMVAHRFTNEAAVAQVLEENAPRAGLYYLPPAPERRRTGESAAFVNVSPQGYDMNLWRRLGGAIAGQWIAALLVVLLLAQTTGLGYWRRVVFVALAGLAAASIIPFPFWNWFGFPTPYVVVTLLDTLIAWFLAGLVMAALVTGQEGLVIRPPKPRA